MILTKTNEADVEGWHSVAFNQRTQIFGHFKTSVLSSHIDYFKAHNGLKGKD